MNCSEAEYLAPLYWSNELESRVRSQLQQHLQDCATCAREWEQQKSCDQLLQQAVEQQPLDVRELRARMRAQMQSAGSRPWLHTGFALRIAAGVAVLALVLAGEWFLHRGMLHSNQPVQVAQEPGALYADAADDHYDEVVQRLPREWLHGPATIQALTRENIGDHDTASLLAPAGYQVDRIRLCSLLNHHYLHIVYKNAANRELSLFLRRGNVEPLTGERSGIVQGKTLHCSTYRSLQVAGFQTGELTVLLVSDLSKNETLQLAGEAAQHI